MSREFRIVNQGKPKKGGFTLLEILIVVAIIALLIAILLAAMSAARGQASRVACQSNLKDLHRAWTMYLDAHRGFFPVGANVHFNYGGLQGQGSSVFGANAKKPVSKPLNRYFGSPGWPSVLRQGGDVFRCPCDTGVQTMPKSASEYCGTSYACNVMLVGRALRVPAVSPCSNAWEIIIGGLSASPPRPGLLANLKSGDLFQPAQLMLMADATWLYHWDAGLPDENPFWHGTKGSHNVVFLDGHAGFVPMRKGIHVDPGRYSIAPTKAVFDLLQPCQREVPCP